jgi:hypothetical protein
MEIKITCKMMIMNRMVLTLVVALVASTVAQPAETADAPRVEVRKIWDAGQHNAFTDLIRWRGQWWCTFRESEAHVGGDGRIRVITSVDGNQWDSAALVEERDIDLRDPKFSLTPDDRLMIVCGGSLYLGTKQLKGRQSRVLFSADGRTWTAPQKVLAEGDWLWRVTWHEGQAYGAAYRTAANTAGAESEWSLKLYRSRDGLKWELVSPMEVSGHPNETTLRFRKDGELVAMVRRETGSGIGWVGTARAPYKQWTWHESDHRFGGPNFIELPDGGMIAGTRDYTKAPKYSTLIARMTMERLEPIATLPSGGDNSYPGMAWDNGTLWVSYYSSHEGRTSVYLARLKAPGK